jgi:hypothetical protein
MDFLSARARLDILMALGVRWERIEDTIKHVHGVTEDERAALWLYAFVTLRPLKTPAERREARAKGRAGWRRSALNPTV